MQIHLLKFLNKKMFSHKHDFFTFFKFIPFFFLDCSTKSLVTIDEGDIRWCRFGLNIEYETYGKGKAFSRPVLIVKKFSADVFWGVPITTKEKSGSWYFHIKEIGRNAILNQLRLLDRKRLEERLFLISQKELSKIRDKLVFLLKS